MCSPPKPSVPEINPYEGLNTDQKFADAQKALGIKNVDNAEEVRKINAYIAQQDYNRLSRDEGFTTAEAQLKEEGLLSDSDALGADYFGAVQARQSENANDAAYAESQAQQQAASEQFAALMEKQAEDARNYRPKQADLPPVMAPVVQPKPIPVAPPTPRMEIQRTPPAPELTRTDNNMAIIKQSSTARSRLRRRTRGTASLSA
jgi:hypothetical protein